MTFTLTIRTREELELQARRAFRLRLSAVVDSVLDDRARDLGYASAAHLASFAGSGVADWASDAQAFIAWRDSVWMTAMQIQSEAAKGATDPDPDRILAALPDWPAVSV